MNHKMVIKVLGKLLLMESLGMILPLLISVYYAEADTGSFLVSITITGIVGLAMSNLPVEKMRIKVKDGLAIVTMGWVLASLFGSLPFMLSGSIPSFVDAFFETMSGFTTTGATILNDIEVLPHGILFWRSFTHWIGGMGILVVAIAMFPVMGAGGFHVFKAESPGPVSDKISPRIKDTAKILYVTYTAISLLEFVLLMLGGMSPYESAIHTFGTLGTGGFSSRNGSIGAFDSAYLRMVITVFMIMAGANFTLYYGLFKGRWREVIRNSELRLYLGIIAFCVVLITIDINMNLYHNLWQAFQDAFFQVTTIITTTGYTTVNFDGWSTFSKGILFMLMFVGGSAGSTGGSIKVIRILTLLKMAKRETVKIFHPRAVVAVKVDGKPVKSDILLRIASFFALYMFIFSVGTMIISLEGVGIVSASSAVAATLGNIGPGFALVGPAYTYSHFSVGSKLLLSLFMLLGRLELFTVMALFTPGFWRSES